MIRALFVLILFVSGHAFAQSFELGGGRIMVNMPSGNWVTLSGRDADEYRAGMARGAAYRDSVGRFNTPLGPTEFKASRHASAATLAKAGKVAARLLGPVALGLELVDIVWNPTTQEYEQEGEAPGDTHSSGVQAPTPLRYWYLSTNTGYGCYQASNNCTWSQALESAFKSADETYTRDPYVHSISWVSGNNYTLKVRSYWCCGSSSSGTKERTWTVYGHGSRVAPTTAVSDFDLETHIADDLYDFDTGPDFASRLDALGYPIEWGSIETSGVASIEGPTTTTTSTGPAGTTVSTSRPYLDFDYSGDTINGSRRDVTTTTNPDGSTDTETTITQPNPGGGGGGEPAPETPGLCDLYPDISACQELGEPDEFELEEEERSFDWESELSATGSCPSPLSFNVRGQAFEFSYEPACTFAGFIRPIIIGLAWLSAGIFLFSTVRKS